MVLSRVQLILATKTIGSGQSTKLRTRQVSERSRTDGRMVKGDAEGIVRPDTVVTGGRPRLLAAG
jgi:hypothetical protein